MKLYKQYSYTRAFLDFLDFPHYVSLYIHDILNPFIYRATPILTWK